VKLGQSPLVTLKIGQGQPKVNQVGSIDHKTFLLNLIEICSAVFSEPRSQIYMPRNQVDDL
jgi:hypothetical protein